MNISKSEILRKLPIYNNFGKVLVKDQNTSDIIKAIIKAHELNKSDYNKICSLFYTGDEIGTAKNIFNYIKKNVKYVIEPDDLQQIKNASAFFATPSSDCKNYALAINGILDACRRKYGFDCELFYRFAAYDGSKTPQHVFSVMVIDGEEVWIDPVLDYFNEDKRPNFYKDKKINNMALMALSGVDPYKNIQNAKNRSLSGFDFSNISSLLGGESGGGSVTSNPIVQGGLSMLPGGPIVAQILPQLEKLFGKTNPLDFAANTEYGRTKYLEMYPDIRASRFASQPFQHFADFGGIEGRYWFDNPSVTKETIDDYYRRYPDVQQNWGSSVLEHYKKYGQSEGRTIKLNLSAAQAAAINNATGSGGSGTNDGGGLPGGSNTQTAGISPLIILALVGAGAAMFLRKK